ncbi:MAG: histidine kinase [Bryobacteraceae bacterium]|nr:histidine kinase [Bryobacteraceae bacterium]
MKLLRLFLVNSGIAAVPSISYLWLAGNPRWDAAWELFAYSVVYSNVIGGLATWIYPWLGPKMWRVANPVGRWGLVVLSLAALATVGSVLASGLLWAFGVIETRNWWRAFVQGWKMSMILSQSFGLASFVFHLIHNRLEAATLELRTRELEKERAEKLASEARLQSLESRIHPHFLFNALNSVSALIREDPARAEKQIERISRFLRFAIDHGGRSLVSVEEEMRTAADYLEIERTRFGDRLRYSIDVAPETAPMKVPPMSVQTLIENSVKYAVSTRRAGGEVRVSAGVVAGRLHIEVFDDGPGFEPEARPAGHGLDLIENRLAEQFGPDAAIRFRNGAGMTVILDLPCART